MKEEIQENLSEMKKEIVQSRENLEQLGRKLVYKNDVESESGERAELSWRTKPKTLLQRKNMQEKELEEGEKKKEIAILQAIIRKRENECEEEEKVTLSEIREIKENLSEMKKEMTQSREDFKQLRGLLMELVRTLKDPNVENERLSN